MVWHIHVLRKCVFQWTIMMGPPCVPPCTCIFMLCSRMPGHIPVLWLVNLPMLKYCLSMGIPQILSYSQKVCFQLLFQCHKNSKFFLKNWVIKCSFYTKQIKLQYNQQHYLMYIINCNKLTKLCYIRCFISSEMKRNAICHSDESSNTNLQVQYKC